ncbi:MAG: hypothetical protein HY698_15900 [Deltaproteobacteria bacterium]|nr:hypothetical protein [Deltaproteobacteria bacterium]
MKPVIVNQSSWGCLRVTGSDRTRFLQGMVTNDVATLAKGAFVRAAILSVKGRVLALVDIVNEGDSLLVLSERACAATAHEVLERHAIMDDVGFTPIELPIHRAWSTPEDTWTAPPVFESRSGSPDGEVEVRRVEGGLPKFGVDVSDEYFPFEAGLDQIICRSKGCFVGQEVVVRAHARGHANKRLVGIRLSGEGIAAPGTPVFADARPDAGKITSSVVSPLFGPIALAYVHRSSWEPGNKVVIGGRDGVIAELPFTP